MKLLPTRNGLLLSLVILTTSCSTFPRSSVPREHRVVPDPAGIEVPGLAQQQSSTVIVSETTEPMPRQRTTAQQLPSRLDMQSLSLLIDQANPRLAQSQSSVESARGQAQQAGLYPNPVLNVTGEELSDDTDPSGIWTVGASQEIVTGGKLGLSQAAADRYVDQTTAERSAEHYRVLTEVRQNFIEVLVLQKRSEILADLVMLSGQSLDNAKKLLDAKEVSRLDIVQLEIDSERYLADLNATKQSIVPAFQKLAASAGAPDLPFGVVSGEIESTFPPHDLNQVRVRMLALHPELKSARLGVDRARLLVRRAEAEPIPNLTISSGYTRQGQNDSDDWNIGVSVPLPLWNRNQGNVYSTKSQVSQAVSEVIRVQNDLIGRLSTAIGIYAAARERAERYRTAILPRAEETYSLSFKAYQGGQFEYLRVLQAQRAVGEAKLEYLRALGDLWKAGSEIAGLSLDDNWPAPSSSTALTR